MIDFSGPTREAIDRLAKLTGRGGKDWLPTVVQDALRTFQWVVDQQQLGRTIVALEPPELELLARSEAVSGEREFLAPFVTTGAAAEYPHVNYGAPNVSARW